MVKNEQEVLRKKNIADYTEKEKLEARIKKETDYIECHKSGIKSSGRLIIFNSVVLTASTVSLTKLVPTISNVINNESVAKSALHIFGSFIALTLAGLSFYIIKDELLNKKNDANMIVRCNKNILDCNEKINEIESEKIEEHRMIKML